MRLAFATDTAAFVTDAAELVKETGVRRQETGGRGRVGWVRGMALSSPKQKSRLVGRPFLFYSISSEYHTERINRPNIIEGIRV